MIELIQHYIKLVEQYGTIRQNQSIYITICNLYKKVVIPIYTKVPNPDKLCPYYTSDSIPNIEHCYVNRLRVTPGCNLLFNIDLPWTHELVQKYLLKEISYSALMQTEIIYEYGPAADIITVWINK